MKTIAQILDEKAVGQAKGLLTQEAFVLETLCEMRKNKVFAELNYSGVFDYCERRLKLSRAQSFYFKSLAEKADVVPEIKEAILQGELSVSQARRIVTVITPENQAQWISKAKELSQVELEREVTKVNPNAMPRERIKPIAPEVSELRAPIDTATLKDLEVLKDLLSQKKGRPATLSEVIAWATSECRKKHDPLEKAERSKTRVSSDGMDPPFQTDREVGIDFKTFN